MTTNKDDNPPGRTIQAKRLQPQQQQQQQGPGPYRDADELDPHDARGHGDKRTQAQGRGNDPDRG